jgi:hypothetical protein
MIPRIAKAREKYSPFSDLNIAGPAAQMREIRGTSCRESRSGIVLRRTSSSG